MTRYRARFYAYCGMSYDVAAETDDVDDVRQEVARFLKRRRAEGIRPYILRDGRQDYTLPDSEECRVEYECPEPEECQMVPDTAGVLVMSSWEPEEPEEEEPWEPEPEPEEEEEEEEEEEPGRCDDPGAHGPGCRCDGGEPVL